MHTIAQQITAGAAYPVQIAIPAETEDRNRLTSAFRIFLALPHLLLVGAPAAATFTWAWTTREGFNPQWGTGGALGAVAGVAALIAWFAIVFTGKHPEGLWRLSSLYLQWRVRAIAYTALLTDRYPPFGEGPFPVALSLQPQPAQRDRLTVGFRIILALPQLVIVWLLSMAWGVVSVVAWFAILFSGHYPKPLYHFACGALRWNIRVEAYLLLLVDDYPPFTLDR